MFANYHTHTARCQHASGEDREYVEAAIRGGLKVLGFSDHCPWVYEDDFKSDCRMTATQFEGYADSILSLKKEYEKDITIYLGLESEYLPEMMEAQDKLLRDYPVDYMLLGQHFLNREPYGVYSGNPTACEEHLIKYVDLVIEAMESGRYRYVAHPDLIYFTGDRTLYDTQMLRLCRYLKEKDIPVEINLLGILDQRHYPAARFLSLAKQIGNKAIIGIDAHTPDRLERNDLHELAYQMAKDAGLEVVPVLSGLGVK